MSTKIKISLKRRPVEDELKPLKKFKISQTGIVEIKSEIDKTKDQLLQILFKYREGIITQPFLALVEPHLYPDYYIMIKNPIALNQISDNRYETLEPFKADVLRCFSNCRIYNLAGSAIYIDSQILEALFLEGCSAVNNGLDPETVLKTFVIPRFDPVKKRGMRISLSVKEPEVPIIRPPKTPIDFLFDHLAAGDTKLFFASFEGDFKGQVNTLVTSYIFKTPYTWTLLHAACYAGQIKVVENLLELGGNLEMEDTWYQGRPLAWAAFGGHPKLCRLLLDVYKADKKAKNAHGQVAFDLISNTAFPHWRSIFSDERKVVLPKPAAPLAPLPQTNKAILGPRRLPSTPSNPVKVVARPASSMRPLNSASKKVSQQISVRSDLPSRPAETLYSQYMSQHRPIPTESNLISLIGISSQDHKFTLTLPLDKMDIGSKILGHFIVVPSHVITLSIRLHVQSPFKRVQYLTSGYYSHGSNCDELDIKNEGQVQDLAVTLEDGVGIIEVAVSCIGGDGDDIKAVHQTQMITYTKARNLSSHQ